MPFSAYQKEIHVNPTPPDLLSEHSLCDNKGIVLRGHLFQLRVRVPAQVAGLIGRKEIRLSLRTANRREALRRGLPLLDRLERLFDDIRRELVTEETVKDICQKFHHHLLHGIPAGQRADMLMKMPANDVDVAAERYRKLIDVDKEALRYGTFDHIGETVHRFAASAGITIDRNSDNYALLLQESLMARIMAFEIKEQRALGNYDSIFTTTALQPAVPAAVLTTPQNSLTINELCQMYVHDKFETDGAWDEHGTLNGVRQALKNFRCIIGGDDVPVATINRQVLNEYKQKLAKLPNQKLPQYSGKELDELLTMEIPKKDFIARGTINNQLIWVIALFEWASMNDHIIKNYGKGLVIKRSIVDKNRMSDCDPYTDTEIRLICEHMTYNPNRLERFWGPLIAFKTGARLNEVGQLLVEDVVTNGGVLCIKIAIEEVLPEKGKSKKLKTQASKRSIPVHKLLLDLGFEKYVRELRKAGEVRLFPKLPASDRGYGVELGKWYGREISKPLFPGQSRRKVFNSSRHSVDDKYKNMPDLRDSMQQYLTGHATGKEDFDRYGSAPLAAVLRQYVDRIDYGIDISILKQKKANPVFGGRGRKKKDSTKQPIETTVINVMPQKAARDMVPFLV